MVYRTYTKGGVERSAPRLLCQNQSNCGTSSCGYAEIIEQVKSILRQNIHDFNVELRANNQDARRRQEALVRQLEAKAPGAGQKGDRPVGGPGRPRPRQAYAGARIPCPEREAAAGKTGRAAVPSGGPHRHALPRRLAGEAGRFTDALNALDTPDLSAAEKNRLLKACIEKIIYRREKLQRQKRAANWASPPVDLSVELKT